jgi:hypothetical protein
LLSTVPHISRYTFIPTNCWITWLETDSFFPKLVFCAVPVFSN